MVFYDLLTGGLARDLSHSQTSVATTRICCKSGQMSVLLTRAESIVFHANRRKSFFRMLQSFSILFRRPTCISFKGTVTNVPLRSRVT
jgi:hypothetical protein